MDTDEYVNFAKSIENEVYSSLKRDFSKRTKEISNISVELFKNKFWYHSGVQRSWNRMEEDEIDNLFKSCRKELGEIFETFKTYKMIKNPLKCN